jgi:hypothetical protein
MNSHDSAPVTVSAAKVEMRATLVAGFTPWARYSATKAMTEVPTSATSTALLPSSSEGRRNTTSTSRLTSRPPSAPTPRQRPKAMMMMANNASNNSIGDERSYS